MFIKKLFKDVLQEALKADLYETLVYGKHEVSEKVNSRNGYSKKTIKIELGEIALNQD
ncbi:transposase [Clostridium carnis]